MEHLLYSLLDTYLRMTHVWLCRTSPPTQEKQFMLVMIHSERDNEECSTHPYMDSGNQIMHANSCPILLLLHAGSAKFSLVCSQVLPMPRFKEYCIFKLACASWSCGRLINNYSCNQHCAHTHSHGTHLLQDSSTVHVKCVNI